MPVSRWSHACRARSRRVCAAGASTVVIVGGLGGGIGGGAAPVVARLAGEAGACVLALATLPFSHEGPRRLAAAREAALALHRRAHATALLRNDALLQLAPADAPATELFAEAARWVGATVAAIASCGDPGLMLPVDPDALRALLPAPGGRAVLAVGLARGEGAAVAAVRNAFSSPLFPHGPEAERHAHLFVYLAGGASLSVTDCQAAVAAARVELGGDRVTLLAARADGADSDQVEVVILAVTPPGADPVPAAGRRGGKVKGRTKGREVGADQAIFSFAEEANLRRGIFGTSAPNLIDGEDVDIPTYLRKGIRVAAPE